MATGLGLLGRWPKALALLLLALTVAALLQGSPAFPERAAATAVGPHVGQRAPDFTLTDLEGKPVTLSSFRGRPVMLNFWATWCPPCREEMPRIQAFVDRHRVEAVVLGVNLMEDRATVSRFVRDGNFRWRFLLDSTGAVGNRYQIRGIPTTLFLDREGRVRIRFTGPVTEATLEDFLRRTKDGGRSRRV